MPTVDIFLPVCNEPIAVLANAWNFVSSLDYPLVTVNVLDDGAKDDVRDLAAQFCFQCEPFSYHDISLVTQGLPMAEKGWVDMYA